MNVIWVVSDTLRKDHIGSYGNKKIRTPSIDSFAAKSVRFDRHYIASFPTMPTRADHLTGRWTMSFMQWEPLPQGGMVLPELLANDGIHTAAIVDTPFYLRNGMNYDKGFRTFIEIPGQAHFLGKNVVDKLEKKGEAIPNVLGGDVRSAWRFESDCFAPQTFIKAMQWLERHHKEDFLLYIDTWDPHEPWDPPNYYSELYWPGYDGDAARPLYGYWPESPGYTEEKVLKAHAAYCGEITMVDTWFGYFLRMVENLGLLENTAIIFTSDHGYYFGEHNGLFGKMVFAKDKKTGKPLTGVWSHSPFYEEVAACPLFIYVPGIQPAVYKGLTSAIDLMPTTLEIMNQVVPAQVEGRSLMPQIKDQKLDGRDYVISAHPFLNGDDSLRSVDGTKRSLEKDSTATITTQEWSLLYNTEPGLSELYHLPTDPSQLKNIIAQNHAKARELHALLVDFMQQTKMSAHLIERRKELLL